MKKIVALLILTASFLCACQPRDTGTSEIPGSGTSTTPGADGGTNAYEENNGRNINYLCGVDQFGRAFMPVAGTNDKQVGVYYFLWHGMDTKMTGTYNITQLLAEHPDDLWNPQGTELSPVNTFHYWDEPLFGYYRSTDRWVIAKHIEMLTLAGVDFLYLDATNADPYYESFDDLASVLKSFYNAGWDAPKVVFYTNSYSILTINRIYENIYKKGRYDDMWYRPDGVHPMIIGNYTVESDKAEAALRGDYSYEPEPLSAELTEYFDLRESQWPNEGYRYNGIPWNEWSYPQPLHNGVMNVSLAQHPQLPFSNSIKNRNLNWGRGYDFKNKKNVAEDACKGTNAQSQWDTVLARKDDVHTVTVTGWNEWTAIKLVDGEKVYFVDTATEEFSRDMEPPKNGGYEDAFYLQLCDNIRRFKGLEGEIARPAKQAIDVGGDAAQWESVQSVYYSGCEKGYARNCASVGNMYQYMQEAPRNNLRRIKAADDGERLYFLVENEKDFVSTDSADFVNIYIGTGTPGLKGWESYEYVAVPSQGKLYRLDGTGARSEAGDIEVSIRGNKMQLAVRLSDIGKPDGIYFKAADNVSGSNIMDTYTQGKCMPMGRLSWYYYLSE